jgi:alpha-1,3/alpha-1,6-mannosyltransferase
VRSQWLSGSGARRRFERKKDLGLAIKALAELMAMPEYGRGAGGSSQRQEGRVLTTRPPAPRLLLAGGWDPRLPENVEHLRELQRLVGRGRGCGRDRGA